MNDSQLANDRTFLAWLRTGISLFGFGFVIAKIALLVEPGTSGVSDQALYTGIGVLMVLSGAALVLVGYFQHVSVAKSIDPDDDAPAPLWTRLITAGIIGGAVALSALIIVTT